MAKDGDGVVLTAANGDKLEVLIMTGEPLNEPAVQQGLFVMNSAEEICQAWEDFQSAKNGFKNACTWVSEIGKHQGVCGVNAELWQRIAANTPSLVA